MSHVFVSYSRKNYDTVDIIVGRLDGDGIKVWHDRQDIQGGELWSQAIVKAVDRGYAFVLMASSESVASDHVCKEVYLASGANKDLIPVLIAPAVLPDHLTPRRKDRQGSNSWVKSRQTFLPECSGIGTFP